MSSAVKSMKFDYLSSRDVETFFFSDDEDSDFNFKYVPSGHFKHIVKDVRRQRTRRDDEKLWSTFLEQRAPETPRKPLKPIPRSSLSEINLELHNLNSEEPLRTHRVTKTARISKRTPTLRSQDDPLSRRSSVTLLPDDDDEDDASTLERSPVSKLDVKSKTSSAETTVRSQTHRKNRLLRKLNHLDCNSSPDLSSHCDSDEEDLELRPHPTIAQRILCTQAKVSELLDEILYRLSRIPRPDGENDLKRRQRCVLEFGVRFSRNYLYELGRQVADIQRHLRNVLAEAKGRRRAALLHMQALEQKLSSSHQLLAHALSAYCNHIPSSVLQGHPGKLKEILAIVVELKNVCDKINLTAEAVGGGDTGSHGLGDDLQNKCYAILSKIRHSDNEPFSAPQSAVTAPHPPALKRRNSRLDSLKILTNRFSMYSIDSKYPRTQRQRRPVTVGICPKDRSVTRSINNPPPTPEQIYANSNRRQTSGSGVRRKNRINGYREDDIRTMMDVIPTPETVRNSQIDLGDVNFGGVSQLGSGGVRKFHSATSNESKISIRRRANENSVRNPKVSTKSSKASINGVSKEGIATEGLSNLVPVIADLMSLVANKQNSGDNQTETSVDALLEILQRYQQADGTNGTVKSKSDKSSSRLAQKNVLVYLNDEDTKSQLKYIDASCQAGQENLRLTERKDCRLTELVVSEVATQRLLNYRDEYYASSRASPMYTSNSPNKPWEVVAWIADKLVDELIVDVSKELQIDDVIRKIFELEFLEF